MLSLLAPSFPGAFSTWRLPVEHFTTYVVLDTLAACEILITENLHLQWLHTIANLTFSPATDLMFGLVEIFNKGLVNNRMAMNVYVYFFFFFQ